MVSGFAIVALGALVGLLWRNASREPSAAEKEIANSIGMRLMRIPAGEFLMGCEEPIERLLAAFPAHKEYTAEYWSEEFPRHRVRITRPFFLGKFEVTVGQFKRFVEETSYKTDPETDGGGWGFDPKVGKVQGRRPEFTWRNPGFPQSDEHPVVNVTWNDAVKFCEWLGRKEGAAYRLPTEAEWEYSCRAGTTTRYHNGDDPELLHEVGRVADPKAWKEFPSVQKMVIAKPGPDSFTVAVGRYKPNAFGLHDMHGNVWEWCSDFYEDPDYYAKSPVDDPKGPEKGEWHARRGGGWNTFPMWGRSCSRNYGANGKNRICNLGFRVVREIAVSDSHSR